MITCMLLPADCVPARTQPLAQWGEFVMYEAPLDALPHGDFYPVTDGVRPGVVLEVTEPGGPPRIAPFEALVGHDVYEDASTHGFAWAPGRPRRFVATVYAPAETPVAVLFEAAQLAEACQRAPSSSPLVVDLQSTREPR